jgi:nucleoside-diphosphate-sugar epimerase
MGNVLVTGASGFIGGFICNEVVNRGHICFAAVRPSSDTRDLLHENIHIIHWDFNDVRGMADLLSNYKIDYIIHNAGLTKSKKESEFFKVNAEYLENLCEAVSQSAMTLKKLVFVSSLAAYGPADFQPGGIVSNSSVPHPVTIYGRSKLKAEQFLQKTGLPYIIIRPTAVYGPRERDLFTVYQTINQGVELVAGFKPKLLTFTYVKDLVRLIIDSMESPLSQKAYFVSDGKTYEARYFNTLVKQLLAVKTITLKLPYLVIGLAAHISGFLSSFTGKYPPLNPEKMNEIKAESWNCDISDAQKDLNFRPMYMLEDGLKETMAWYKEAGWIK